VYSRPMQLIIRLSQSAVVRPSSYNGTPASLQSGTDAVSQYWWSRTSLTAVHVYKKDDDTVMATSVLRNQLTMRHHHDTDVGNTAGDWTDMYVNRSVDRSDSE
jgi:hypothetical protein